jgi:hypothetical protein
MTSPGSFLVTNDQANAIGASDYPPPADVLSSFGVDRWASRTPAAGATVAKGAPGQQLIVELAGSGGGKATGIEVAYTSGGNSYVLEVPQGTQVAASACT